MHAYDPIWPRLAPLALVATFGPVRHLLHFLALFDPVWPHLTLFGTIWHHLILFGPAWLHLALLGHSSILISRYQFTKVCTKGEVNINSLYFAVW